MIDVIYGKIVNISDDYVEVACLVDPEINQIEHRSFEISIWLGAIDLFVGNFIKLTFTSSPNWMQMSVSHVEVHEMHNIVKLLVEQ